MRVPDLRQLAAGQAERVTVGAAAKTWLARRISAAESTRTRNGLEVDRISRLLGTLAVEALTPEKCRHSR